MSVRVEFTNIEVTTFPINMDVIDLQGSTSLQEDGLIRMGGNNFQIEELLTIAIAIFEYIIPIMHKEEQDKIPF